MTNEKELAGKRAGFVVLAICAIVWVIPILLVFMNSFKQNTFVKTATFALPTGEMGAGWVNYIKGVTFGNYPFLKSVTYSVTITIISKQ